MVARPTSARCATRWWVKAAGPSSANSDQEGIWGEVVYPSLGMWANIIKDRVLVAEGSKALNDWAMEEIQLVAPNRLIATAMLPLLDVQDAVAETYRAKDKGFYAVYMPTVPPPGKPLYNADYWEPLWAAIEETGLVLTIHIGTDGETTVFRGPGGAVMNYVETTYGGQRRHDPTDQRRRTRPAPGP